MVNLIVILFTFFVQFTDKSGSDKIALSQVALDKRAARSITIDSMDYAVSPVYIDSLRQMNCHIHHFSRWMNGVSIEADSATIQAIAEWSFVDTIYLTRSTGRDSISDIAKHKNASIQIDDEIQTNQQIEQLNLHLLHNAGFEGQGITIAIIDGGFQNINHLSAFDNIREQILGIFDTTDDTDSITGYTGSHGTKCFSTIAAITTEFKGAATSAQYYLIRSEEYQTESPKEMDNWVVAIELADSLGVDIVSSSLGYAMFDDPRFTLSYADINGKTTRCSRAAEIAAAKGLLVVVAAGNEGNSAWHYISAPADAENILTVGAVDPTGQIATFSSWGPSADGRVKPEVCAIGNQTEVINPINNNLTKGNGTSFACPIIAGMAACLWSAIPHASNLDIRDIIIQSSDRFYNPHDQYGYGIPNAWKAFNSVSSRLDKIEQEKESTPKKIFINGVLWIMHNGEYYNIMGQKKG